MQNSRLGYSLQEARSPCRSFFKILNVNTGIKYHKWNTYKSQGNLPLVFTEIEYCQELYCTHNGRK